MSISVTTGNSISSFDGISIFYRGWVHPSPVAFVYVSHGMSEHSGRYDDFAKNLAIALQVSVFATDHRGHGHTACPDGVADLKNLGSFETKKDLSKVNCLDVMAQDVLDIIERNFAEKSLPIFLFGHSMGSLISRCIVRRLSGPLLQNLRGVVLSGVPTVPPFYERGPLLLLLNSGLALGKGRETLHEFIMGKFDDQVRKLRGNAKLLKNCFITSVNEELAAFTADPLCGQTVDLYIWKSLRRTLIELMDPKTFYANATPACAYMFISGREDPICNNGQTAELQAKQMTKLGLNVAEVYLSNCLHEFLHESPVPRKIGIDQVNAWIRSRL